MAELGEWKSFYVIVGSAAAVLIGMQFVMMTPSPRPPSLRAQEAGAAFATPTIVHFGTPFFVAALLRMPWHAIGAPAVLWGVVGLGGLVYTGLVVRRMRAQTAYRPRAKTGCSMPRCPSWRTATWRSLRSSRSPTFAARCSESERRRCCCSASASTTRGTPWPTTCS